MLKQKPRRNKKKLIQLELQQKRKNRIELKLRKLWLRQKLDKLMKKKSRHLKRILPRRKQRLKPLQY